VEALIAAILQAHPAVRDAVRGATDAEIDELARLSGEPLPPSYRAFLRFMGKSAGAYAPLRVTRVQASPGQAHDRSEPIDTSIDLALRRYRSQARRAQKGSRKKSQDPPGAIFLGQTVAAQDLGWFFVDLGDPERLLVAEHDSYGSKVTNEGALAAFVFARHFPAIA
jgi:hypothetical protein